MTITLERSTTGLINAAYEAGVWCYWNDESCPFNLTSECDEVASWYEGYVSASRTDPRNLTTHEQEL